MSIDLEVDKDGVATVTINRADVHNALDAEHYAAISKAWQTVRDDPQIRCARSARLSRSPHSARRRVRCAPRRG